MSIPDGYKHNFETLKRACLSGDLALVECTDAQTGEPVIAVCAISCEDDDSCMIVPVARMFDGNPYECLIPPSNDDTGVTP